jgi:hypothetical protein
MRTPTLVAKGNSIRYLALSPRDDYLKVEGLDNLFCAGEKAGLLVGHTEAICTGTLAGHNAVRYALGRPLVTIPRRRPSGEAIAFVREEMQTEEGMAQEVHFLRGDLLRANEGAWAPTPPMSQSSGGGWKRPGSKTSLPRRCCRLVSPASTRE